MSPAAQQYLSAAIDDFKRLHINRTAVNWAIVEAKARELVKNAQSPADTYPAIRLIIKELGEKHTFFQTADQAKASATGVSSGSVGAPPLDLPEGAMLAGGIGLIRLMAFSGSVEQGKAYTAGARHVLDQLDDASACGWIVDLRFNTGGNMWPMLNGVGALLGEGPFGFFDDTSGARQPWVRKGGVIYPDEGALPRPDPDFHMLRSSSAPVAVLIGGFTVSSGEFTAMAFKGRARTRFFGQATGNFITANKPVPLSDGAAIVMTVGWGEDRTGTRYSTAIVPDERVERGQPTLDAALRWLKDQGCPRSG